MVAHTGFEPVISALRGRCPWPLDECATKFWLPSLDSNQGYVVQGHACYRYTTRQRGALLSVIGLRTLLKRMA